MKTILIAGGTGFLGKNLTQHFIDQGDKVIILGRGNKKEENRITFEQWDGKTKGNWSKWIDESDIVINLTGKSVDCRYTEKINQKFYPLE